MTKRVLAIVFSFLFVGSVSACGSDKRPPPAPSNEGMPAWADVFDGTPDLYAVVRPKALKRDGVYGEFFKALMRAAQARGLARGDTMVQAVEGADEIVVGLNQGDDAAVVLRGVPANLDPQKVTDAEGHALFRPTNDRAKVVEYELLDPKSSGMGALFVLPDRTWVGALGEARGRARQAFATPSHRPGPEVDADAVAVLRISGPLAHVLDRHPSYGALAKKLSSATFSLKPGKGGLVLGLSYVDADATAWAEMQAKRLVEDLSKDETWAWLKAAKVAYEGNTVYIRVAVPPRLLEELPSASGASLGL